MRTHTHSAEAGGALGWRKKVADVLEDKFEHVLRVLDAAQALCKGHHTCISERVARLREPEGLAQSHLGRKG